MMYRNQLVTMVCIYSDRESLPARAFRQSVRNRLQQSGDVEASEAS